MNDPVAKLIADFERDCAEAGTTPPAMLKSGGVHASLWWKWKSGKFSPSLRNFTAARQALEAHRTKTKVASRAA